MSKNIVTLKYRLWSLTLRIYVRFVYVPEIDRPGTVCLPLPLIVGPLWIVFNRFCTQRAPEIIVNKVLHDGRSSSFNVNGEPMGLAICDLLLIFNCICVVSEI